MEVVIDIKEEWSEINNYPGYFVSNYGNVFSAKVNRMLKPTTTKAINGYKVVFLSKNNHPKGFLIHRLVYEAFVGPIPDGLQINHIDENKHNNRLDNLELLTQSENLRYGSANQRRIETIRKKYPDWSAQLRKPCINETTGAVYESASEAARQLGCSRNSIINACNKRRKTCKGYIWSYIKEK